MKVNWKEKLSSRKFWAAIGAVIIAVAAIFGIEEATTAQVVKVVAAIGALVAYILGEAYVDGKMYETDIIIKGNAEVSEE